jgi:hypothetical protein
MTTLSLALCACASAAPPTLSADDKAYLDKHLPGVLLGPATEPDSASPVWLPLQERTFTYAIPGKASKTNTITLEKVARPPGTPVGTTTGGWCLTMPGNNLNFLRLKENGTVEVPTQVAKNTGVVTRLNPPSPLLLGGIGKDLPQARSIAVRIYDLHEPSVVAHSGDITTTWTDLGRWQVKVPLGTWTARLIKTHTSGKVGPASVDGKQFYLLVDGIGPVAFAGQTDISAFLLYHDDTHQTGVLKSMSKLKAPHADSAQPPSPSGTDAQSK